MVILATTPLIALVLLVTVATGTVRAAPEDLAAAPPETHVVIATIELGERTVEFVRSAHGGVIGVAEIAPAGTVPLILAEGLRDASPAELFARLAPGIAAPQALRGEAPRDDAAPNGLTVRVDPVADGIPPVIEETLPGFCSYIPHAEPGHSPFTAKWYHYFGALKDHSYQELFTYQIPNNLTEHHTYLGASVERWMGACHDEISAYTEGGLIFRAEFLEDGVWQTAYSHPLPTGSVVTYHSFSPTQLHWRLNLADELGYVQQRSFGIGLAWNEPVEEIVLQQPEPGRDDERPERELTPREAGSTLTTR
jgi:hypothetical protein